MNLFHRSLLIAVLSAGWTSMLEAQQAPATSDSETVYVNAVGAFYGIDGSEVTVLGEWVGGVEQVPVLLFLSSRGGIAPDVLGALRRRGSSWANLARRFAVDPASLLLPLRRGAVPPVLGRVYDSAGRPRASRTEPLTDPEIVALANLRMFAVVLDEPVGVLVSRAPWSADYPRLLSSLKRRARP